VNHNVGAGRSRWFLLLLVLGLFICATRPAPDFGGRWKGVNRYAASTEEIPLSSAYLFHASPMDGTLKAMLTRWSKDSKMTLSYLHPSDFTLYEPVAKIRTNDLQQAVAQLTAAYAGQKVLITASKNQIVVNISNATSVAPTSPH
jgi:hypothetical protein